MKIKLEQQLIENQVLHCTSRETGGTTNGSSIL